MKHLKTFEKFENRSINEEIFGLSKGERESSKKAKLEKAKEDVLSHPSKRKVYQDLLDKNETDKADKYIEFFVENPDVKYAKWDDNKDKWVDSGKWSAAGHTFGSGQ